MARTPDQALGVFVAPLQRSLSCVTDAIVVYRRPRIGRLQSLNASQPRVRLRATGRHSAVWLMVDHEYEIVRSDSRYGPWTVTTRGYHYRIDDAKQRELALWRWHPAGTSTCIRPHLHAQAGDLRGLHLPSGRVSIEAVIRATITEFGVQPLRADWEKVLLNTEEYFETRRTWA